MHVCVVAAPERGTEGTGTTETTVIAACGSSEEEQPRFEGGKGNQIGGPGRSSSKVSLLRTKIWMP